MAGAPLRDPSLSHENVVPLRTFAAVYERERPGLLKVAFLLTGSDEVAEDLVQDAFVGLHRRFASVQQPGAYLRRSVINGAHSHHRKLRVRRRVPLARDTTADLGADEMLDLLAALPARQRAAVVLRFYEDLSEQAIADALGVRAGTVGSLIHRGLARLRQQMEET